MAAASGDVLLAPEAIGMMRDAMIPLAALATPNLREAELLTGARIATPAEMAAAARAIVALGARAALVKGGALEGDAIDVLFDGSGIREFRAPRVGGRRVHGAGCTLSAAIAAGLALGRPLERAIADAKAFVTRAIETAPRIGHGASPLNHLTPAKQIEL